MERYHITITDNETGKEFLNIDTDGFIMATHRKYDGGKETTQVNSAFDKVSPIVLANIIFRLSNLTKRLIEENIELKPLLGLMQKNSKGKIIL